MKKPHHDVTCQYVLLPSVSTLPTEAHPFTIASIPGALDGTDGPDDKELVFLCRTREGFTDRMRLQTLQNGKLSVPAFVDGYAENELFLSCLLTAHADRTVTHLT